VGSVIFDAGGEVRNGNASAVGANEVDASLA
jgi:hypothetical protein